MAIKVETNSGEILLFPEAVTAIIDEDGWFCLSNEHGRTVALIASIRVFRIDFIFEDDKGCDCGSCDCDKTA